MSFRRTVVNKVGQGISMEITPDGAGVIMARTDIDQPPALTLDALAARILVAFLSSALEMDRANCEPERIGDVTISMHARPTPVVRIDQRDRRLEIHAPGWQAIALEMALLIPRLVEPRTGRQTS